MKKILKSVLIFTFILIAFNHGYAQIPFKKGVKGGLSYANFYLDPESKYEYSYYPGLVAGLYLELDMPGPVNFQGELLFSQKGAKFETPVQEVKVHLNYIEIPVLLLYKLPLIPTLSFNIQGGGYFGMKLDEHWEPGEYVTDGDLFKQTDYGIVVGAGFGFNALFTELQMDVRYAIGMANISEDEAVAKNRNLIATVGIGF